MQIKIKELPSKEYVDISDTDIMVIEDSSDTKQIPVSALKLFFSSDSKIKAISDKLDANLEQIRQTLEQLRNSIDSSDDSLAQRVTNLYNDHEATKRRLGKLTEDVVDVQNHIKGLDAHFTRVDSQINALQTLTATHSSQIKSLQDTTSDHEKRLVELKKDDDTNKTDIANIKKAIKDLNDRITQEITRLDKADTDNKKSNIEYSDRLYNDAMRYIDYYHHIHTNPPNFDEPYKGDPIVANYIHPVATNYTTSDPDFDPNEWFPGAWKYVGVGASYNNDMTNRIDYYTYIRMK